MEERRTAEVYTHDDIITKLALGEQQGVDNRKLLIWLVSVTTAVALFITGTLLNQAISLSANRASDVALYEQHKRFEADSITTRRDYILTFNDLVRSVDMLANKIYMAQADSEQSSEKRMSHHEEVYNHDKD